MLHQTFLFLWQLWQLFEVSQILEFLWYIQSLTTASGSRLFGSEVEHWIIDQEAWIRFPPKSWDFFSLICYALFFLRLSCCKNIFSQSKTGKLSQIPEQSFQNNYVDRAPD